MKLGDFASEYGPSELPVVAGDPLINSVLDSQVGAVPLEDRIEHSLSNMLGNAVYLYYFAKRAHPQLGTIAARDGGILRSGLEVVDASLVKQAVVGIASTVDLTTGRTNSLPHALGALEMELGARLLQSPDPETQASIELLQHIRSTTNADVVTSLRYVRHLRNKWAGHSSLDRMIDSWAQANATVHFPLLEDALVRMVNAYQDLGDR